MAESDIDGSPPASWWQVRRYCYICGWVGYVPGLGYHIVRRHLRREAARS